MNRVYLVTDEKDQTEGGIQWGIGIRHVAKGRDRDLNTGLIMAYENQYMTGILNPVRIASDKPVLWRAEADGKHKRQGQYQCDFEKLTTLELVELPQFRPAQYVAFAIYCAQSVYGARGWNAWASAWLSGTDRSNEAALDALAVEMNSVTARLQRVPAAAMVSACEAAAALALGKSGEVMMGAWGAAGATLGVKGNLDFGALAQKAYNFERVTSEAGSF